MNWAGRTDIHSTTHTLPDSTFLPVDGSQEDRGYLPGLILCLYTHTSSHLCLLPSQHTYHLAEHLHHTFPHPHAHCLPSLGVGGFCATTPVPDSHGLRSHTFLPHCPVYSFTCLTRTTCLNCAACLWLCCLYAGPTPYL